MALDDDGRGGRALDKDAATREETAAEEVAVAAATFPCNGVSIGVYRRFKVRLSGMLSEAVQVYVRVGTLDRKDTLEHSALSKN